MALLALSGFVQTHDATIVKENGVYYRVQTGMGIPVSVSKDLHHWDLLGKIFEENPLWTSRAIPGSTSLWAPEIVFRNGEWRVYYSVSTFGSQKSAIGLVVNKTLDPASPEYCWHDLGCVLQSDESCRYNAIDPAVISDEQGNDHLLFGSFWGGLQMVPLTKQGFVVKDAEVVNIASRRTEPNPVEGGFIIRKDGYYYLFASYDFCCRGTASTYHIVCGRSENLYGPYYDSIGESFLESGGDTLRDGFSFKKWAGPGHNSVFADDDGKYYLVYHAYDREDNGEPKLLIEELFFENGWPKVKV